MPLGRGDTLAWRFEASAAGRLQRAPPRRRAGADAGRRARRRAARPGPAHRRPRQRLVPDVDGRRPAQAVTRAAAPGTSGAMQALTRLNRDPPSAARHKAPPAASEAAAMDTRTSPIRLRLERVRDALRAARPGRRAGAVERPAPVGIPARALAGPRSGCRASPARWARWWSPPSSAALFADSRYWSQAEARARAAAASSW